MFILVISLVLLVSITFTMIFFVVKYSRKKNPVPKNIESNLLLEITWTVIPTILVLAMFYYGWSGFRFMRTAPEDAMMVKATGRMWSWQFEYENGKRAGELRVPLARPVKLIITSQDVIHSLFIPAFRIKQDAIPDRETFLWFLPDKAGEYDLFCSEYCGVKHSSMVSKVIVMDAEDFHEWYELSEEAEEETSASQGAKLLDDKGCLACHTTDGTQGVGPGFKGLFSTKVTVLTGGKEREVIADESYLKNSMLRPGADIVKGFGNIMPSQKGNLSEEEINEIITYIKSLK